MASEREVAKGAITERDDIDPELKEALSQASGFQLDVTKENNRHREHQRAQELGLIGKLIGGEQNAPGAVALFVVLVGYLSAIGCMVAAGIDHDQAAFWSQQVERGFGVGSAALAYLFGKGTK